MTSPPTEPATPADGGDDQGMHKLIDELLLPYAKRVSSGKKDRVDLQPESLIASVIEDHLDEAIQASGGSEHAVNNLRQAIKYKFLDRLRKGGKAGQPDQFSQGDPDNSYDPQANQFGPMTIVEADDTAHADEKRHEHFCELVLGVCSDDADRVILTGYLIGGEGWPDVAQEAGLSEPAARKRMSRLRGQVLTRLIEGVRDELNAEMWVIAEGAMINRQPAQVLAQAVGRTEQQVERMMMSVVTDCLALRYGAAAIEPIGKLLPKRKR